MGCFQDQYLFWIFQIINTHAGTFWLLCRITMLFKNTKGNGICFMCFLLNSATQLTIHVLQPRILRFSVLRSNAPDSSWFCILPWRLPTLERVGELLLGKATWTSAQGMGLPDLKLILTWYKFIATPLDLFCLMWDSTNRLKSWSKRSNFFPGNTFVCCLWIQVLQFSI